MISGAINLSTELLDIPIHIWNVFPFVNSPERYGVFFPPSSRHKHKTQDIRLLRTYTPPPSDLELTPARLQVPQNVMTLCPIPMSYYHSAQLNSTVAMF